MSTETVDPDDSRVVESEHVHRSVNCTSAPERDRERRPANSAKHLLFGKFSVLQFGLIPSLPSALPPSALSRTPFPRHGQISRQEGRQKGRKEGRKECREGCRGEGDYACEDQAHLIQGDPREGKRTLFSMTCRRPLTSGSSPSQNLQRRRTRAAAPRSRLRATRRKSPHRRPMARSVWYPPQPSLSLNIT